MDIENWKLAAQRRPKVGPHQNHEAQLHEPRDFEPQDLALSEPEHPDNFVQKYNVDNHTDLIMKGVQFDDHGVEVFDITLYSKIYGKHPKIVFGKHGMILRGPGDDIFTGTPSSKILSRKRGF